MIQSTRAQCTVEAHLVSMRRRAMRIALPLPTATPYRYVAMPSYAVG
jgi:hypothetical protein